MHSRAMCAPGCEVDADGRMRDQSPQVHPGVDVHGAPECPALPGRGDSVADEDDLRGGKGGAQPGHRRGRIGRDPRTIGEDELIAREPEPVMPVQLRQRVHRHVHIDPRGWIVLARLDQMHPPPRGQVRVVRQGREEEHRLRVPARQQGRHLRRQLIDHDRRLTERRWSGQRRSPVVSIPSRSKAPSGSEEPAAPGTRTETGAQRDAAPAIERMTKASSDRRSSQWQPTMTAAAGSVTSGPGLRCRQALEVQHLRSQPRHFLAEGISEVRAHRVVRGDAVGEKIALGCDGIGGFRQCMQEAAIRSAGNSSSPGAERPSGRGPPACPDAPERRHGVSAADVFQRRGGICGLAQRAGSASDPSATAS